MGCKKFIRHNSVCLKLCLVMDLISRVSGIKGTPLGPSSLMFLRGSHVKMGWIFFQRSSFFSFPHTFSSGREHPDFAWPRLSKVNPSLFLKWDTWELRHPWVVGVFESLCCLRDPCSENGLNLCRVSPRAVLTPLKRWPDVALNMGLNRG